MPDTFDIKYTLLPPELQVRLWVLGLDANTSKVNIAYQTGAFRASVAYNYSGNFEASMGVRRYTLSASFNPSSRELGAGLVYRGFNFESSANSSQFKLGFGYGRKILPFPDELWTVFNAANTGLMNIASDIGAASANPFAFYNLHSNDVAALGKGVSVVRSIAEQSKSTDRFGLGLRIQYSEPSGFLIYGAGVLSF